MKSFTVVSIMLAMVIVIGLAARTAGAATGQVDPLNEAVYPMSHPYYVEPVSAQTTQTEPDPVGEAVYPMSHPYYVEPVSAQTEPEPVGEAVYPMSHPYYVEPAP
jgi:hypothetical protein